HVARQRVWSTMKIDRQGVIEHHVDRHRRSDAAGRVTKPADRAADRRQVSQQRNAGGAVEDDAADLEWNFTGARRLRLPACKFANLTLQDMLSIAVPDQRFQ